PARPLSRKAPYPTMEPTEAQSRVRALQRMTRQAGIDARLYAAQLVRLDDEGEWALVKGRAATINDGPYALVRLPDEDIPDDAVARIPRLRRAGVIPMLTHVERIARVRRDVEVLEPLIAAGALCQVTLSSLTESVPADVYRTAVALLTRNLAHVFGSGAHGSLVGPLGIAAGLRAVELLVGSQRRWEMAVATPQAILTGAPLPTYEPSSPARARTKGFWTQQDAG
ncbi:MAG TPA: CpsB/CapC family capsule biosynthesis tyrosine phosphatase, partial [Ktedonobacterales bacterium]|nr:CpsB/CapC family capsule biosynthesis tyrosine phosphatase [Ktedonobacterales bacterium]